MLSIELNIPGQTKVNILCKTEAKFVLFKDTRMYPLTKSNLMNCHAFY